MTELRVNELSDQGERPPAQPAGGSPGRPPGSGLSRVRVALRAAAATVRPRALWQHHRLFTILVLLAIVPRVIASLAFRPALTTRDSFDYLQEGVHLTTGQLRPAGYPMLLRLLEPFHSLLLVTSLQHLLGIGIAIILYAVLRHWGLPGWGAALAAVPTLFDYREIVIESYILADLLYAFIIISAVALLLTRRTPRLWQCVLAGLLLSYSAVVRGNGLPLIVPVLAFMLIRRVGWRAFTAGAAAFVLPVLAYASLFDATWGKFNLTNSDGLFLWSRVTSFANCAVIKPPPDLVPLCPSQAHLRGSGRTPSDYLWASNAWFRHDAHPGINAANNALAMRFALDAIKAQPLSYAKVVSQDVLELFLETDRPLSIHTIAFTLKPDVPVLPASWALWLRQYGHAGDTHAVQPYAHLMLIYEKPVYFPGLVFIGVLVIGFVGVVRNWRRWGGPGALPWAAAAIGIVLPPALVWFTYRYVLEAVPLACMAAGLAFVRPPASSPEPAVAAGPATVSLPAAEPAAQASAQHQEGPATDTGPAAPNGVPAAESDDAEAVGPSARQDSARQDPGQLDPGQPDSAQQVPSDPGGSAP